MRARRVVWLALLTVTPWARGQVPETDPEIAASPHAAVYTDALAERFVACLDDEGSPPTAADRATLTDMVAALGPSVARGLGGDACDDTPAAQVACAARVRALSCDQLATRLTPDVGAVHTAAPPAWAAGHARSIALRVRTCAAQERDGAALDDDEWQALAEFESGLASALGALQTSGACAVDENALPACARSIAAIGCDGLGARIEDDPATLARAATPECAAMIRCGAAALDDGGDDEGDATLDDVR